MEALILSLLLTAQTSGQMRVSVMVVRSNPKPMVVVNGNVKTINY